MHDPATVEPFSRATRLARLDDLLRDVCREFGLGARLAAPIIGRAILWMLRREDRRLKAGWTYEPPTFYERNYEEADADSAGSAAGTAAGSAAPKASVLKWVSGLAEPAPVAK